MNAANTKFTPAGDAARDVRPIPPRFWWTKRIALAALIYLVALLGVRWIWGIYAENKLAARLAECRAAGEPMDGSAFAGPDIPDEENAAVFIRAAAAAFVESELTGRDAWELLDATDLPREQFDAVAAHLRANAETLSLLASAAELPGVSWHFDPLADADEDLPDGLAMDSLGGLVCLAAMYEHQRGNDSQSIRYALTALQVGDHCAQAHGFLLTLLIRDMIARRVVDWFEDHSGTLDWVADARLTRELIATLLADDANGALWADAMYAYRLLTLERLDEHLRGSPIAWCRSGHRWPWIGRLVKPAWQLDTVTIVDSFAAIARVCTPTDYQTAHDLEKGVWSALVDRPTDAYLLAHSPNYYGPPVLAGVPKGAYETSAQRRLAGVAIALRLFEAEHGELPGRLAELVPTYLPALPADPFSASHDPIRFARDGAEPRVYSIGVAPDDPNDDITFVLRPR